MNKLIIIGLILLFLAFFWELKDYNRLHKRPNIYKIKSTREKIKELKFYATYNSENNIFWRSIFIISFLAVFAIYNMLKMHNIQLDENMLILTFTCIFLIQYFAWNFKVFHLYRVMTSKISSDKKIL